MTDRGEGGRGGGPLRVLPGGGQPSPAVDSVAVTAYGDGNVTLRLRRSYDGEVVELGAAALSPGAARALAANLLVVAEAAEEAAPILPNGLVGRRVSP